MKQDQERQANRKDLEKVKRDLGDQVQQVLQAQQQQQQTAENLMQENQRLMTRINQLADYNNELENEAQRIKATVPVSKQKTGVQRSIPQGSPNGSVGQMKQSGATHSPSPVIQAHPLEDNSTKKFQFTNPEGTYSQGISQDQGRSRNEKKHASHAAAMLDDDMSEAGSEVSSGTIRRGLQIIKEHAPKNVYRPSTRGHSMGRGKGHYEAAANAVPGKGYEKPPPPTRVTGKGVDNFQGGSQNKGGHHGSQGRLNEIPFDQTSHAEGDVSIPSVYSEPDYDPYGEDDDAHDVSQGSTQRNNGYNQGARDNYRRRGNQGQAPRGRNEGRQIPNDRGNQPPYQRGRGDNFGRYPPRRNDDRDPYRPNIPFKDPKLSKYDGKIPWRAYEVKLMHMARKYDWDDDTKLAKLVEALDDKALTFFSNLPPEVQGNFEIVKKKMNNRFIPREPSTTVRKQLQTIQQKPEEALEEWAERCQQCAFHAWGEKSEEVAELAAVEAFLGGVLETEAAVSVSEKDPCSLDEALEMFKKAVHSRKSLSCRFRNTQRTARTVSFAPDPITADVRTTSVMPNSSQPDSKASIQKLETDLQDLRSTVTDTQGQIAKILELLTTQRDRGRSRSPSPSANGPCYCCGELGHIARNCPSRPRSPSPASRRENSTNPENP